MRTLIFSIILFILSFGNFGCSNYQTKKDKIVSKAIWSAKANIEVGKVSKAKLILDEASRLFPKPKDIGPIEPLKDNSGKAIVLLPKDLDNKQIIIENTPQYNKLVSENDKLAAQIREDNKYIENLSRHVDDAILTREQELQTARRKSYLSSIFALFSGLGLIGTILLVVFFPAALPFVISFIKGIINWFIELFRNWVNSFKKNG